MKQHLFITIVLTTAFSSGLFATNDSIQTRIDTTATIGADTIISAKVAPLPRPIIYDSIFSVNHGDSLILIEIIQDIRIEQLLYKKINNILSKSSTIMPGFRVQVFSSNTQQTAKEQALKIEEKMKKSFPGVAIYVSYQSPFWKVRMGDFTQQTEAQLLRSNIIEKFPALQGDIYLVKENIEVSQ